MTSVIRHLLPIRNSLPSTSTLSDLIPKAALRGQAILRKFGRQNIRNLHSRRFGSTGGPEAKDRFGDLKFILR